MNIYIKQVIWFGRTHFYVGHAPSNPSAPHGFKLGGYFIETQTIEAARAIASSEARRVGGSVVECPAYIGL